MDYPKLKSHRLANSGFGLSLQFDGQSESLVLPPDRLELIRLLDGKNSLKEIWDKLRGSKSQLKLSEVYLTLERLKKAGGLVGEAENQYFDKNWLDYSLWKMRLWPSRPTGLKNIPAFLILSSAILLFSLFSMVLVFRDLPVHGLLQVAGDYVWSIPLLIAALSVMAVAKGLLKVLMIVLGTGQFPEAHLCYRRLMFDLEVDESSILIEGTKTRRYYEMTKAFCFLFLGVAASSFIKTDLARQIQIVSFLMTFIWLNPYRKSELTQVISHLFDDEELRSVRPYLQKKALSSFMNETGTDVKTERKLVFYACVSLLWTFSFIDFAQDVIVSNAGFWLEEYAIGNWWTKATVTFFALAVTGLLLALIYDLASIISNNFLRPFINKLKQFYLERTNRSAEDFNRQELVKILSQHPFMRDLTVNEIESLAKNVSIRACKSGFQIINEGELGNELFLLLNGKVRVQRETGSGYTKVFSVLEAGSIFGEVALLEQVNRTADVIAETDAILAVLKKEDFDRIWGHEAERVGQLLGQQIALSRYFSSSELFRSVPSELTQIFVSRGQFEKFSSGQFIVKQGGHDQTFYLLLEGNVEIVKDGKSIGTLNQGSFFGEIAIFENLPRIADVIAQGNALVLKIDRNTFWEILTANMELAVSLEFISESRREAVHAY